MKTYRLISLLAAVLITAFFTRILAGEPMGGSSEPAHTAAVLAP